MDFTGMTAGMMGPEGLVGDNGNMLGYDENLFPEAHLEGEYQELHSLMIDGGNRFGASTVAFDGQEELLWVGNLGGHVTSYYGLGMQKYTSFQVHPSKEVRQILTVDDKVLSLTSESLRCNTKFGRSVFTFMGESMQDTQCMLQTSPNAILIGGHQPKVVELDISTQQEIRQVEVNDPGCAILKYSNKFICAGDTSGKVTLRDPNSLRKEHVLEAHSGTLSDFDVHGNQLITCGFSNRMGNLQVDRYLMMYDLRVMRAMTPMQVMMDPMFLRFVPTYSNRVCVVSQTGQFQLLEQGAMTPSSLLLYQVRTEGATVSAFDLSASCQAMAFGDHGGYLHLFTSGDQTIFNLFSGATELPTVEPVPPMSVSDELAPLSIIPMQYPTTGKLLSDWPSELYCQRVYRKAFSVESDVLRSMKVVQNVGYAPNPGTRRRNQCPYKLNRSSNGRENQSSVPDSPIGRGIQLAYKGDDPFVAVPKRYRKVEIKYSKLGVEDFDFRHYNKTNFAGLETHIPNAYCNAMLQMLYFIEPLRIRLLSHLCEKEFCLACELGFLFHMLDLQKGGTCQASNFLRAFRTIPEASALGLILGEAEESTGKVNLARLIQNWNRFILQQVHSEIVESEKERLRQKWKTDKETAAMKAIEQAHSNATQGSAENKSENENGKSNGQSQSDSKTGADGSPYDSEGSKMVSAVLEQLSLEQQTADALEEDLTKAVPKESIISKLFGTDLVNKFKCRCGEEMTRDHKSSVFDLIYPDITQSSNAAKPPESVAFSQVVQQSMCLEQPTQAWCNKCDRYQPHVQTKNLQGLPDTLVFNCHLENGRDFEFWKLQEEIVKKVRQESAARKSPTRPYSPNVKTCRYGNKCTRKDCHFKHENDAERNSTPESESKRAEIGTEPGWVPLGLKLKLDTESNSLTVENIEDDTPLAGKEHMYYELLGSVAHIKDFKTGGNLVSHIKVAERYHQRKEHVTCTQWYLLNDFSITPVEKYEAVYFDLEWKVPCVLYFVRRSLESHYDLKIENPITSEALFQNASLVTPRRRMVTFTPLDDGELPKEDDIVGLDAEFVTLNQEEAELRSDGTRSTIKPSQMSVARVTCVRGKGHLEGEPFIDDYISTQEQVVDYLTQFSGIKPGDLDASLSSKHLTTLKSTYVKLRYLVDTGCIFVGHGLKKDFRVINLVVPKDQVIDTVELFHLPRQRMISLKFLARYFLGMKIQSATHDSIEDARAALKLYNNFQEMCKEGMDVVRTKLREMYSKGREMQWKVPLDEESKDANAGEGSLQDALQPQLYIK